MNDGWIPVPRYTGPAMMEFLEYLRLSEARIRAACGIPPHWTGP